MNGQYQPMSLYTVGLLTYVKMSLKFYETEARWPGAK